MAFENPTKNPCTNLLMCFNRQRNKVTLLKKFLVSSFTKHGTKRYWNITFISKHFAGYSNSRRSRIRHNGGSVLKRKTKSSPLILSFVISFQGTKFHLLDDSFTEHNVDDECSYVNTLRILNEKVIQYLYRPLHLFTKPTFKHALLCFIGCI
jgi:hypothetical protein